MTERTMSHHQQERKGKHHEETPAHRLRHLCLAPVSVWLTCGNEYAFNQSSYSRHSTDHHCKRAERLQGFARSASPPQSGVPCSKCSTCHGSGWEKYAASRRGATEAHQTPSVHRPDANAAESLLAHMWAALQPELPSFSRSLSGSRQVLVLIPRGLASFMRKA